MHSKIYAGTVLPLVKHVLEFPSLSAKHVLKIILKFQGKKDALNAMIIAGSAKKNQKNAFLVNLDNFYMIITVLIPENALIKCSKKIQLEHVVYILFLNYNLNQSIINIFLQNYVMLLAMSVLDQLYLIVIYVLMGMKKTMINVY